jgi:hypothetical protein
MATLAATACAAFAGCGGGSGSSTVNPPGAQSLHTATAARTSTSAFVARANAICRATLRRATQLGKRAGALLQGQAASSPDLARLALKSIIKPGIPILESEAQQMRRLRSQAPNPAFDQYVALFDPIDALAHELRRSGANENVAINLESRMSDLGSEQRALAHRLGLRSCEADFLHALSAAIFP